MKWGGNEAERRGGLFQTAGRGRGAQPGRLSHSPWTQKPTGPASEGLERGKETEGRWARPTGGKTMAANGERGRPEPGLSPAGSLVFSGLLSLLSV